MYRGFYYTSGNEWYNNRTDLTDAEKAAGATWTGCNITSGRLTFYSDDNITTQFKLNVVVAIPSVTVTATRGY